MMRDGLRHLWVSLLTLVIVMGMGLQGLPVPCQSNHCGDACSTACLACPATCTCHLNGDDDTGVKTPPSPVGIMTTEIPPPPNLSRWREKDQNAPHEGHATSAKPVMAYGHANHGTPAALAMAHGHGSHDLEAAPSPDAGAPHCQAPAPTREFPDFSLPPLKAPALLATAMTLHLAVDPGRPPVEPEQATHRQPPPLLRPPTA